MRIISILPICQVQSKCESQAYNDMQCCKLGIDKQESWIISTFEYSIKQLALKDLLHRSTRLKFDREAGHGLKQTVNLLISTLLRFIIIFHNFR